MNPEQKQVAIQLLLEKSTRNMEQAIFLANTGYWDLIVNRLYYSLFHAITAMMLKDEIPSKTHKGTSQQFGKHFVLTGTFSKEDGRFYNRLQEKREQADYDNVFNLSKTEGNELIKQSEILQKKILEYVLK